MKRVRFVTPSKVLMDDMDEAECHSPRPFLGRQPAVPTFNIYQERIVQYTNDPVERFDNSNSSPYPTVNKTSLAADRRHDWTPSGDLDLSMLDSSNHQPRAFNKTPALSAFIHDAPNFSEETEPPLTSIENKLPTLPNVLSKDNSFFIRRDNLDKYNFNNNPLHKQINKLYLDKENDPWAKKAEIMKMAVQNPVNHAIPKHYPEQLDRHVTVVREDCNCHQCTKVVRTQCNIQHIQTQNTCHNQNAVNSHKTAQCCVIPSRNCKCTPAQQSYKECHANCCITPESTSPSPSPQSAVDRKTWAIQKYEQSHNKNCTELEKQTNVTKEKREPTVADLFKIIKLQNEQLQLLQEKVDKFISAGQNIQQPRAVPAQNFTKEQISVQTIDTNISEHKTSIGVMTSFEMVRTSTVINKEFVKQTTENAQIQCNRSQISIKEVVSKQPVNFLEGIPPCARSVQSGSQNDSHDSQNTDLESQSAFVKHPEVVNDDKTLNELSLCNVQVDNSTTPQISPEQSLYLDVRDYSESDSSSDDQSNVGWTYYNKVMTHVNGMLQDSDMPSSASAMYRNTRPLCVQMQIDKTNLSVTKRVTFGDDPLSIRQTQQAFTTDTSMKMNQLAAKYLKSVPKMQKPALVMKNDMSFATRDYMETHNLLQGTPRGGRSSPQYEVPNFLDITALKQQPKFL